MSVRFLGDKQSDGWSFGQATTDLISFHGVTPVAMRSGSAQAAVLATAGVVIGTGGTAVFGYSSTTAAAIPVLINEIRATLVEKGIFAGA